MDEANLTLMLTITFLESQELIRYGFFVIGLDFIHIANPRCPSIRFLQNFWKRCRVFESQDFFHIASLRCPNIHSHQNSLKKYQEFRNRGFSHTTNLHYPNIHFLQSS